MHAAKSRAIAAQFVSIKQQASDIVKDIDELAIARLKLADSIMQPEKRTEVEQWVGKLEQQAEAMVNAYDFAKGEAEELGMRLPTIDTKNKDVRAYLRAIIVASDKAIGFVGAKAADLSAEEIDKLDHIRKEVKKVCEHLDINFEKNLEIAIADAERGSFLGSTLVASRIVTYVLSKIEGEKLDEKISTLIRKGAVDKERDDVKQAIIKAHKKSRNFLAHRIDTIPDSSDALSLLGDCVKILSIYGKAYPS